MKNKKFKRFLKDLGIKEKELTEIQKTNTRNLFQELENCKHLKEAK